MLNNVPSQINRSARLVVLRHPNAMDCAVMRKKINRTSQDVPPEMGGLPTIGGLGVLDSEDEADYEYEKIGDAKIIFAGQYQGEGSNWNDADTTLNYPAQPMEALIECVLDPSAEGYFEPNKPDLIMVMPGAGIVIPYAVSGETGNVNIPPYTKRYILMPLNEADVGI